MAALSHLYSALDVSWASGSTGYSPLVGQNRNESSEERVQIPVRTPGTFSYLSFRVSSNRSAITFSLRIDGADGNQIITTGSAPVGDIQDTTHTDTITGGEKLNYRLTGGTGGNSQHIYAMHVLFAAENTTAAVWAATSAGVSITAASTTTISGFAGLLDSIASGSEANRQWKSGAAGTLKNMAVCCTAVRSTATDFKSRINGADGALLCSVVGVGITEDTTHSDTIALGDLVNASITTGTGTDTFTFHFVKAEFVATNGTWQTFTGPFSFGTGNTTRVFPIGGSPTLSTVANEALAQTYINVAQAAAYLSVHVSSNSRTGSATNFYYRVGGVNSALTVQFAASGTGWQTDTTHTVNTNATDLTDFSLNTGTGSQNISVDCIGVRLTGEADSLYLVKPGVGAIEAVGLTPILGVPQIMEPGVGAVEASGFAPTAQISSRYVSTERRPAGDVGRHWQAAASSRDGANLIAACERTDDLPGRVYISTNFGESWTESYPNGDRDGVWQSVASDDDGSHLILCEYGSGGYGSKNGRLWTSSDGGANWIERRPDGVDHDLFWYWVASDSDGSNLIAVHHGEDNISGRVYVSSDYGSSWTESKPIGDATAVYQVAASNADGSVLFVSIDAGRLWLSINGGVSWSEVRPAGDVNGYWFAVAVSADGSTLLASEVEPGHIYLSTDKGANWTEVSSDRTLCVVVDSTGNAIAFGDFDTSDDKFSLDRGGTWDVLPTGAPNSTPVAISDNGRQILSGVYGAANVGGRLYTSVNSQPIIFVDEGSVVAEGLAPAIGIPQIIAPANTVEYALPANTGPRQICLGPDGNLWFTEFDVNKIGRIAGDGTITHFDLTASSWPRFIVSANGYLWITCISGRVVRMTTDGEVTDYNTGLGYNLDGICLGPDGNLWITAQDAMKVVKMTTGGSVETTYDTPHSDPRGICVGPDGNLWIKALQYIEKLTTGGSFTSYGPLEDIMVADIVSGPDGNLWFAGGYSVGKITTTGTITEYIQTLSTCYNIANIVVGPDGALWLTDHETDANGDSIIRCPTDGQWFDSIYKIPSGSYPKGIAVGGDGALWICCDDSDRIDRFGIRPVVVYGLAPTIEVSGGESPTALPGVGEIVAGGLAPDLILSLTAYPAQGEIVAEGLDPVVLRHAIAQPAQGTIVAEGLDPARLIGSISQPEQGAIAIAGLDPIGVRGTVTQPEQAGVSVAGLTPSLLLDIIKQPDQGAIVAEGLEPVGLRDTIIQLDIGAIAVDGLEPIKAVSGEGPTVQPLVGAVAVDGLAPTIEHTGFVIAQPGIGAITGSGLAPSALVDNIKQPAQGSIVAAGLGPTAIRGTIKQPSQGIVSIVGLGPTFLLDNIKQPPQGSAVIVGLDPTALVGMFRQPAQGNVAAVGLAPSLLLNIVKQPSQGTVSVFGLEPKAVRDNIRLPAQGSVAIAGAAPVALIDNIKQPATGAIVAAGLQPIVDRTQHVISRPGIASIEVPGLDPAVVTGGNHVVQPGNGTIVASGQEPTFDRTQNVIGEPAPGVVEVTGLIAAIEQTRHVLSQPDLATVAISGLMPQVGLTGNPKPGNGVIEIIGLEPQIVVTYNLEALPGIGHIETLGFNPAAPGPDLAFMAVAKGRSYKATGAKRVFVAQGKGRSFSAGG